MSEMIDIVRVLSEKIGERPAFTENEEAAAKFIEDFWREKGLKPFREYFKTAVSQSPSLILFALISILSVYLLWLHFPFTSLIISLIALWGFYCEFHGRMVISDLMIQRGSQNIFTVVEARGEKKGKILLVANCDSPRSSLVFHPALAWFYPWHMILTFFSFCAIPACSLLQWMIPSFSWVTVGLVPASYLIFYIFTVIEGYIFGRFTPGANNNASGISVIISLSDDFKENPLEHYDLMFLVTGAKEAGFGGSRAFVDLHEKELSDALIITVEGVGAGRICYIDTAGLIPPSLSSSVLLELCNKVSKRHPELYVSPGIFKHNFTECYPYRKRGLKGISIMGLSDSGAPLNYRWREDRIDFVNSENLQRTKQFLKELIYEINRTL